MLQDIAEHIKKLSPLMEESSEIFRELSVFFGGKSKIEVHRGDLPKFLGIKRLYRVIRLKGASYKDCVYQLVDDHPEAMEAMGMLRYYKAPAGPVKWEEIEKAETAMGNELTMNAYGWTPDAWTVFESVPGTEESPAADSTDNVEKAANHELVAILAFSMEE